MKGRGSIKKKANGVKRLENVAQRASRARTRTNQRRAYAQALGGKTPMEQWKETYFRSCAIQRKHRARENEMLATTSLKDLIK